MGIFVLLGIMWLISVAGLYSYISDRFISPSSKIKLLWAVIFALIFSPGALIGHGFIPFPGGLWVLMSVFSIHVYDFNFKANLACLIMTFIVFVSIDKVKKLLNDKKLSMQ